MLNVLMQQQDKKIYCGSNIQKLRDLGCMDYTIIAAATASEAAPFTIYMVLIQAWPLVNILWTEENMFNNL